MGAWQLTGGAGLETARYTNRTFQRKYEAEDGVVNYNSRLNVASWSLFVQGGTRLIGGRLALSTGFRFDGNNYDDNMRNMFRQFSPRLSLSYSLSSQWALNFNTGRYFQRPPLTAMGFRNNDGELVNQMNGIKYMQADHLVAGVEWLPRNSSKISVEGFYKIYRDYLFSVTDSVSLASKGGDFGTFGDEPLTSDGEGRAFGFEVLAREKDFKGWNIILSYTFVRSEFRDISGSYVPSAWDNRHILNLTVLKTLGRNWNIGGKWRLVGGAPYTPWDLELSSVRPAWDVRNQPYPDYARYNTLRGNTFHQLDLRVDKQFFFEKWTLMLYFDVQNAYNFKLKQQDFVTNLNPDGTPRIDPATSQLPYEQQRYLLRSLPNESGTVLPTLGIIVEI
ncbi:MAG: hypothetical protein Kow00127_09870 [Bacteroidales bacterium]